MMAPLELLLSSPDNVRSARIAAGMTQRAAAGVFGYSLRGWQSKEDAGAGGRKLSKIEYEYLLLLADMHPLHTLV